MNKLQFTTYSDPQFRQKQNGPISLQINPTSLKVNKGIKYQSNSDKGTSEKSLDFEGYNEETLSFDAMLDGTGIVDENQGIAGISSSIISSGSDKTDVDFQIKSLEEMLYKYQGNDHKPAYVEILWGKFCFKGQLKDMNTDYLIFSDEGVPLRAKVSFTFSRFVSDPERLKLENRSSPDMSHLVTIGAGDTLPSLCHTIYGNSQFAAKVARANGLSGFRYVTPGTKLIFPRLTGAL